MKYIKNLVERIKKNIDIKDFAEEVHLQKRGKKYGEL